jgi:hypothetical protein
MTNLGQNSADLGPYNIQDTNFSEGDEIMDVLGCTTQTVQQYGEFGRCKEDWDNANDPTGNITTTVTKGLPQVWISTSLMVNSTICPDIKKVAKTPKTSTSISGAPTLSFSNLLIPAAALAAYIFS